MCYHLFCYHFGLSAQLCILHVYNNKYIITISSGCLDFNTHCSFPHHSANMSAWLVVGIAGGTCSGKSTLARAIAEHLEQRSKTAAAAAGDGAQRTAQPIGVVRIIKQDDYFHARDRPEHTWIPGWNYINREIMTALDMPRMCADIERTLAAVDHSAGGHLNVLLIEGFLIFNHAEVRARCDLRFDMRINLEECRRRRAKRKYNPPNPPRYFEEYLWPFYRQHLAEYAFDDCELIVLDAELPAAENLAVALESIEVYVRRRLQGFENIRH